MCLCTFQLLGCEAHGDGGAIEYCARNQPEGASRRYWGRTPLRRAVSGRGPGTMEQLGRLWDRWSWPIRSGFACFISSLLFLGSLHPGWNVVFAGHPPPTLFRFVSRGTTCFNHRLKPTWPRCIPFREGLVRQRPQGLHPCEGRCFSLRLFWIGVSRELTLRNLSQARCWPRSPRRSASRSGRREREFFIDNLLVRIHFIIVMIRSGRVSPLCPKSAFPKEF